GSDRGGRQRPLPKRAGDRQAHGRADHRRAAREGRRERRYGPRRVAASRPPWRRGVADRAANARPPRPARAWIRTPRGRSAAARGRRRERRGADRAGAAGRAGELVMEAATRIQTPYLVAEDELDRSLRPRRLRDFVGQQALREQLGVAITAAGGRG